MSKKKEEEIPTKEPVAVATETEAWFEPQKADEPAVVVAPETPAEEKKAEPEAPKPTDILQKRLSDAQAKMHEEAKKRRELEKENSKLKDAFAKQAEAQGVILTDEDRELADVDPVKFAQLYADKLVAAKEAVKEVGKLSDAEVAELEEEAKADTAKLDEQIAEDAFMLVASEIADLNAILTTDNINKYLTGLDHEELGKCKTHEERFRMGYEKIKSYIGGIHVAKEKMKAGEPVPAVPSLSTVGVADPGSPVGIEARVMENWRWW